MHGYGVRVVLRNHTHTQCSYCILTSSFCADKSWEKKSSRMFYLLFLPTVFEQLECYHLSSRQSETFLWFCSLEGTIWLPRWQEISGDKNILLNLQEISAGPGELKWQKAKPSLDPFVANFNRHVKMGGSQGLDSLSIENNSLFLFLFVMVGILQQWLHVNVWIHWCGLGTKPPRRVRFTKSFSRAGHKSLDLAGGLPCWVC